MEVTSTLLGHYPNLDANNGGINLSEGNSLTIYAQSTGADMGKLSAAGAYSAEIGGGPQGAVGTITINGGVVTATGADIGAGIGGQLYS